jgi:hypothetical protein
LSGTTIKPLALFPPRLDQPDLFETLKNTTCWNCADLPSEIKCFIQLAKDDAGDESFISSLIGSGFTAIKGITRGLQNKRGRKTNRRRSSF